MNFFEAQEEARRASRRLVLLFILSVIALILTTDLLVVGLMYMSETPGIGFSRFLSEVGWQMHGAIALIVTGIITAGSLFKYLHLSAGGRRVAESVGATLVPPDEQRPDRRRLLNLVEEVAIASGTPVPAVYILGQEEGINAFAAGHSSDDAVVCVTQGCLDLLNREQLQGVVAHEFSHILNGDMRLNMRVIGVLHGILLIGLLGQGLIRGMTLRRYSGRGGGREGAAGLMLLGAGLIVIGFAGMLFGRLIKASVGRQREYLADASAVQFTRNPDGIAGALKAIGGYAQGSGIRHPFAPEISHMFLASDRAGLKRMRGFAGFSTHPPLEQRIWRIDPSWDGRFPVIEASTAPEPTAQPDGTGRDPRMERMGAILSAAAVSGSLPVPSAVDRAHVEYARFLLEELPEPVTSAAHEPYGARALVYALLLHSEDAMRRQQLAALEQQEDPGVVSLTGELHEQVRKLGREQHLPVVDLAMPALRGLSPAQSGKFKTLLMALVRIDRKVSPFEWAVTTLVTNTLAAAEDRPHLEPPHNHHIEQLRIQTRVILSVVAFAGNDAEDDARRAFAAGLLALDLGGEAMYEINTLKFDTVDNALRRLERLIPREKERLLLACIRVAEANHAVSVAETEMIRAIGAALHCPVPPVLGAGAVFMVNNEPEQPGGNG